MTDPAPRPDVRSDPGPDADGLPEPIRARMEQIRAELDQALEPFIVNRSTVLPDLLVARCRVPAVVLPERLQLPGRIDIAGPLAEHFPAPQVWAPDWTRASPRGQMLRDIEEAIAAVARERRPAPAPAPLVDRINDVVEAWEREEEDWPLGPDAASWHPDGVYPFAIGPRRDPFAGGGARGTATGIGDVRTSQTWVNRDEVEIVFERVVPVIQFAVEGIRAFAAEVARVAVQLHAFVQRANEASGYALVPPPAPADPRERALAARRNRNTGPPAPRMGHPRHHSSRRN